MMNWKLITGLSVLLLIYILVGALVFCALEFQKSTPPDITGLTFFAEFLANHPNVTVSELEVFTQRVVKASEDGGVVGDATEQNNGWTYDNAVFFTITVVSTIGFGHITPRTTGGKVFCIFFALIGIPLAVALLAGLGSHLRRPMDYLHRARPWCSKNAQWDRRLKSGVVLTVGTVVMLCAPALVFTHTQHWDFPTALYYSTITLTTVGFGDYVAGTDHSGLRIVMCLWLAVGLAYLAMVISEASNLYSNIPNHHRSTCTPASSQPDSLKDPEYPRNLEGISIQDG